MSNPQQSNTIGNASLALGIISAALVFGIGLCALTGVSQNWIRVAGTPLFVCGGSSAFLGFLGMILGFAGLFGKDRSRATAIAGLILGFLGSCLFFVLLNAIGKGG
jgi:riboflavin transporter FmnP